MKIHHLGIVVSDLDEALQALGLSRADVKETVYDPNQKNNLHFVYLEENKLWLEFVEPTAPDASTAKFAKKFGIGLHHLAMGTSDIDAVEKDYAARPENFVLGRYRIEVASFGGRIRTLFVAIKGLILEFVKVEK